MNPNAEKQIPPIQICILDEADSMTHDAQAALRRIIEAYSENTRFCIICNYISKIIDPLASRCVKFRFQPISEQAQKDRLMLIAQNEGIHCDSEAVFDALIESSEGDLRRSINSLQTASAANDKKLTADGVYQISGIVPNDYIKNILRVLLDSKDASEHEVVVNNIIYDGWDIQQTLHQLLDQIVVNKKLKDLQKAKISEIVAETDAKLIEGGNEEINLTYALHFIASIIQGRPQ